MASVLKTSIGTKSFGTSFGSAFGWSGRLFRTWLSQMLSTSPSRLYYTGTAFKQDYIGRVETTNMPCDFGGTSNSISQLFELTDATTLYGDTTMASRYKGSSYDNRIIMKPNVSNLGDFTVSICICLSNTMDFALSMNTDLLTNAIHFMPNVNAARIYQNASSFTNYTAYASEWFNLRYVKRGDERKYMLFNSEGTAVIDHTLVNQDSDDTALTVAFNGTSNSCMFYDFIVLGYADDAAHDKPYVNDDGTLNKF